MFFCIYFIFFKIVNNSFILHSFSSNFYNIIKFTFSQVQILTFRFDFLKIYLTIISKVRFIFFLTSMCNFIAIKNKKKNDDKNILNDCFDWEISMIIRKRSSTTIFCDDNIFSFAKSNFNFLCKSFFACFLMIFKINCDDKLKKIIIN